ncbi:MAG: hypothetical protein R2805_11350 [Flavobacterium sp.]|uniref:hypothetical protein n=1 Tax=Flavobacterium sp. TaxID=239 RepID=UPI003528463B
MQSYNQYTTYGHTWLNYNIINYEKNSIIPSCESPSLWIGQTPGTLGQIIRNLELPLGTTRNITGGSAPSNSSN